jgi:hypothetical protein
MAETYDVVHQDQRQELGPDSRFRDVMHVIITTKPSGVRGEFDIPMSQYSVESVRSEAERIAGELEAIANL